MFDFSKKYSPESIQQEILEKQNRQKLYGTPTLKKDKEKNSINMLRDPVLLEPEGTNWDRFSDILRQDAYRRYQYMLGKKIKLVPAFRYSTTQHDKKIHKQEQREQDLKKQQEKRIKNYIQLGCACDETQVNSTFSPEYMRKIRNTIAELVQQGHIQKQHMINYWSNKHQTHISPEDIVRKKSKGTIYNIRYFVDTKNITLIVATATPENIFGDVALAVHPEDRRYRKLIGHKVIIPIINKTIPIIGEESVDITKTNGVMRVCPCHDTWSLEIAKKHKLKINNFAIDHNGCFTELAGDFCGKKVKDFFENIIQNLDDIHNLQGTEDAEIILPIEKQSKETLEPVISEQRFFAYAKNEDIVQEIQNEIHIIPENYQNTIEMSIKNGLENEWTISKKDGLGIPFPARKNDDDEYFFLSDLDIFSIPQRQRQNKKHILSMIIFNMIADGRLSQDFSIEDIIELLFKQDDYGMFFGQHYLEMLEAYIPRGYANEINELKKVFEYGDKENSIAYVEKCSIQLISIIEKSIGIIDRKGGEYSFNAKILSKSSSALQLSQEKIDTTFTTACMLLEMAETKEKLQRETTEIHTQEEDKSMVIKTLLLGKTLHKISPIQKIYVHSTQTTLQEQTGKEMIKKRGSDATRLCLLEEKAALGHKRKGEEGQEYQGYMSKTRNACRFILQQIQQEKKKINQEKIDLQDLANDMEKKIKKGLNHEYWILDKIKELYEELPEYLERNEIPEFSQRLMGLIKQDFGEKYLEIMKIRTGDDSKNIALFCVAMIIKLLHPLAPFITEKIWKLYNFKGDICTNTYIPKLEYINKNYKTQIFMDIIDKLHHLREVIQKPKHEKIDICISASIDFQQYMKEHEDIIQKLLYTNEIHYIDNERDLAKYETDTIIDVTIGVRGIGKPIKQNNCTELEHDIIRKQEMLQNIRKIAGQLSLQGGNKKAIETKKEEMNQLKEEIERLEYEIKKIRMSEK